MKAAAIDDERLIEFCNRIRQLSQFSPRERRRIVEILLREVDLVRLEHTENLLCIRHTMEARGYASHSTVYKSASRGNLHVFRVCCRDFFDKEEIAALPVKGLTWRKPRVKVGLNEKPFKSVN